MLNSKTWKYLTVYEQIINIKEKLLAFDRNTWNHSTVCKEMSSNNLFKNKVTYKLFPYTSYIKTGFGIK